MTLITNLINKTNINQQDQTGNTPLHYAVIAQNTILVNFLIENGADQRVFNINSHPPLVFAAAYNDKEILIALLNHPDVNINLRGNQNGTSLFAAAQQGHLDIVNLLLDFKADPLIFNNLGTSPLLVAVSNQHLSIVTKLCAAHPELINIPNNAKYTPLQMALIRENAAIVEILLKHGADISLLLPNKMTVLDYAVENGLTTIVSLLLSAGADYVYSEVQDDTLIRPLTRAAYNLHLELVELLLGFPHSTTLLIHTFHDILREIKICNVESDRQKLIVISEKIRQKLSSIRAPKLLEENEHTVIETSVPNTINIIWFGSFLREPHQKRILDWKRINPEYKINIWISREMINQDIFEKFNQFCNSHSISLQEAEDLHYLMNDSVLLWLKLLKAEGIKNYGAISDLYRLYVLRAEGGWYFDTDIIPLLPLPVDLSLEYGFAINCVDDSKKVTFISPSVIVSSLKNAFLDNSCSVDALFAQSCMHDFNFAINSKSALERMTSTHLSTGKIVYTAAGNLLINDHPLSYIYNPVNEEITDYKVYEKISIQRLNHDLCFNGNVGGGEKSWLYDENDQVHPDMEDNVKVSVQDVIYPDSCFQISDLYYRLIKKIQPRPLTPVIYNPILSSSEKIKSSLVSRGFFAGSDGDSTVSTCLSRNIESLK